MGQTNFTLSRSHPTQPGTLQSIDGHGMEGHGMDGRSGHGIEGRSTSGHGMSQSGSDTRARIQATTRAPMIGTRTAPTPLATWRAE